MNKRYATLIALKYAYESGHIHSFKGKIPYFTHLLKYKDRRTVKRHVDDLVKEGLAWWEGNSLRITNREVLREKFNLKLRERYFDFSKDIQPQLEALILHTALSRQYYRVKERLRDAGIKFSNKSKGLERAIAEEKKRVENGGRPELPINPLITITRKKVAEMMGKKSTSSGTNLIRKLKKKGYVLKDKKRICYFRKMEFEEFKTADLSLIENYHFWWFKGWVNYRLPNEVIVKDIR